MFNKKLLTLSTGIAALLFASVGFSLQIISLKGGGQGLFTQIIKPGTITASYATLDVCDSRFSSGIKGEGKLRLFFNYEDDPTKKYVVSFAPSSNTFSPDAVTLNSDNRTADIDVNLTTCGPINFTVTQKQLN